MKTKWAKIIGVLLILSGVVFCYGAWDNTKPADNQAWNDAAGSIRDNWDALETALGVDLNGIIIANPVFDVRAYGAVGDGSTDDTAAFDLAVAALPSYGGTILIPAGDYILSNFDPPDSIRFVGVGNRVSRLVGKAGSHVISAASGVISYVMFEDIGFQPATGYSCIDASTSPYAFSGGAFIRCSFEVPETEGASTYGVSGYIILTLFDNCKFGHWKGGATTPADDDMVSAVYFAGSGVTAHLNYFLFCDFRHCSGPAIVIGETSGSGRGNVFQLCDFENLEDKVAYLKNADGTVFRNCWAEDINETESTDKCVIKIQYGLGNSGLIVDGFNLGGTRNNTERFFLLTDSPSPKIRYQNSYVASGYVDMTIINLTDGQDHNFRYFNNTNAVTGTYTVDSTGTVAYYKDPDITIPSLADDATPSVVGNDIWLTGGTTTITDFDNGYEGQVITIIGQHTLTITDGTNIILDGGANMSMTSGDTLMLIQLADTYWYQLSESNNN